MRLQLLPTGSCHSGERHTGGGGGGGGGPRPGPEPGSPPPQPRGSLRGRGSWASGTGSPGPCGRARSPAPPHSASWGSGPAQKRVPGSVGDDKKVVNDSHGGASEPRCPAHWLFIKSLLNARNALPTVDGVLSSCSRGQDRGPSEDRSSPGNGPGLTPSAAGP